MHEKMKQERKNEVTKDKWKEEEKLWKNEESNIVKVKRNKKKKRRE
jgi:hypothetical protein